MQAVNTIPLLDMSTSTTGCCPMFSPKDWDEKVFTFDQKLFVKVSVRSFWHMPLNMGSVMRKVQATIEEAGAETDAFVMLSYDASPWKGEHYIAVSKEVPGYDMKKLSGSFLTKVFEGKYSEAGKWHQQLIDYAKSKGKNPIKAYFYFTTCPKCVKVYGKNYVVGFAQFKPATQKVLA